MWVRPQTDFTMIGFNFFPRRCFLVSGWDHKQISPWLVWTFFFQEQAMTSLHWAQVQLCWGWFMWFVFGVSIICTLFEHAEHHIQNDQNTMYGRVCWWTHNTSWDVVSDQSGYRFPSFRAAPSAILRIACLDADGTQWECGFLLTWFGVCRPNCHTVWQASPSTAKPWHGRRELVLISPSQTLGRPVLSLGFIPFTVRWAVFQSGTSCYLTTWP